MKATGIVIIILFAAVLFMAVCIEDKDPIQKTIKSDYSGKKIVVVDGCEYISCSVYYGSVLVHKGNCTNHTGAIK